jgi:hypothetical protein
MTNEEIERNIGFVIEQQAQFAVNLQKIEAVQAKFGSEMQEMKDVVFTIVGVVGKLAEAQKATDERLEKLA